MIGEGRYVLADRLPVVVERFPAETVKRLGGKRKEWLGRGLRDHQVGHLGEERADGLQDIRHAIDDLVHLAEQDLDGRSGTMREAA